MKDFRKWVSEHNIGDQNKYILSLIGMISYFFLFTVMTDGSQVWTAVWLGVLVVTASFDIGRYRMDCCLYVTDAASSGGHRAISSVLRYHAFDVDNYFFGMQKRLYPAGLLILICTLLSAGVVLFVGDVRITKVISILVVGLLGIVMLFASCALKKRQLCRELSGKPDTAAVTWLKVCSAVFRVAEVIGVVLGSVVAFVFLWIFVSAVLEPEIDETQIVYRSYTHFSMVVFLLPGVFYAFLFLFPVLELVSEKMQQHRRRLRNVIVLLMVACLVAGGVMTYVQEQRYTELAGNQFRVYDFGLVKEYELEEVESFRIYRDSSTKGFQFALKFDDGKAYKLFGNFTSYSDLYDTRYYSEYHFVEDYAGKLLKQGAEGTLEDKEALEEETSELHRKVQEAWKGILSLENYGNFKRLS